jgi:hypothetical protein
VRRSCARLPVLIEDPALPDSVQELVLADHRPDASISATSTSKTRRPSLIGRRSAKISKAAELHHRGRGRGGELRAMMKFDIFKENHRSSN